MTSPPATAGSEGFASASVSGRGLDAMDVVAKPRAGLAAGFFFFLAPAIAREEGRVKSRGSQCSDRRPDVVCARQGIPPREVVRQ